MLNYDPDQPHPLNPRSPKGSVFLTHGPYVFEDRSHGVVTTVEEGARKGSGKWLLRTGIGEYRIISPRAVHRRGRRYRSLNEAKQAALTVRDANVWIVVRREGGYGITATPYSKTVRDMELRGVLWDQGHGPPKRGTVVNIDPNSRHPLNSESPRGAVIVDHAPYKTTSTSRFRGEAKTYRSFNDAAAAANDARSRTCRAWVIITKALLFRVKLVGAGCATVRSRAEKPSTKKPSTKKPSTKKPSTKKPSTKKPSTKKPSTKKPSTKKPSTKKPSTKKGVDWYLRQLVPTHKGG